MKILDRYIQHHVILATAIVVMVLGALESFMAFVGQLSQVGVHHYSIWKVFLYVLMHLPADVYQLFPMAGFLGSLIGLGRLATSSELVVMRSAGVSIKRIAWAVFKAGVLMVLVMTLLGEGLAPLLQHKAQVMKTTALEKHQKVAVMSEWLKKDNSIVFISLVASPTKIAGILSYNFDSKRHLLSASYAKTGVLINGEWQLHDIKKTIFSKKATRLENISQMPLGMTFQPILLRKAVQKVAASSSLWGLWHHIRYREQAGLVVSQQLYQLWQRLLQPFTSLVMLCLGIPFIFGSLRDASMGSRVLTGVVVGFSFYMLNQLFGPVSLVYQFPPLLAAISPPLLFLMVYWFLVRRVT